MKTTCASHRKLGELFRFKNGRAFKKEEWSSKGLPIIRIQNLNSNTGAFNYYEGEYSDDILVQDGDLLFSWSGTVGSSFGPHIWQRGKSLLNQHIFAVSFKMEIDKQYAYYALEKITEEIEQQVNGAVGLVHITKEKLNEFTIPVPSMLVQRRIVSLLDEAFDGIAIAKVKAEKNLQNARAIFENKLNDIVQYKSGWTKTRLGDIAKTQYGLSESMNEEGRGFKIFRMGEVQDGQLIDTGRMKCADIDHGEFEKYRLQRGDVLFNRTNSFELVGKTGIFALMGDYCFASYLVRVLPDKKKVLSQFLNYFMNAKQFQDSVKKKASKSINQANINATILSNETICFPHSLEEQQAIVHCLDNLRIETQRLESITIASFLH
ncbi:MAG: restriction endonuclease subunit S [Rhabdochlamydiaceae bacterium]